MDKRKLMDQLNKEKKNLGQRIMVLSNTLYFDDQAPAKDLIRQQLEAMDDQFEAIEARIADLEYDLALGEALDDEARKAFDEAEKKACEKKTETPRNFIDGMCDDLNECLDDLMAIIHGNCDKPATTSLDDLDGKQIINTNPPHCHECCNDGTGCVKVILPGTNNHICVK